MNNKKKQITFTAKEDIKKGDKIIIDYWFEDFTDSSGGIISDEDLREAFEKQFGGRERTIFLSTKIEIQPQQDDNYQMTPIAQI